MVVGVNPRQIYRRCRDQSIRLLVLTSVRLLEPTNFVCAAALHDSPPVSTLALLSATPQPSPARTVKQDVEQGLQPDTNYQQATSSDLSAQLSYSTYNDQMNPSVSQPMYPFSNFDPNQPYGGLLRSLPYSASTSMYSPPQVNYTYSLSPYDQHQHQMTSYPQTDVNPLPLPYESSFINPNNLGMTPQYQRPPSTSSGSSISVFSPQFVPGEPQPPSYGQDSGQIGTFRPKDSRDRDESTDGEWVDGDMPSSSKKTRGAPVKRGLYGSLHVAGVRVPAPDGSSGLWFLFTVRRHVPLMSVC
jgi:hypothetical protein